MGVRKIRLQIDVNKLCKTKQKSREQFQNRKIQMAWNKVCIHKFLDIRLVIYYYVFFFIYFSKVSQMRETTFNVSISTKLKSFFFAFECFLDLPCVYSSQVCVS